MGFKLTRLGGWAVPGCGNLFAGFNFRECCVQSWLEAGSEIGENSLPVTEDVVLESSAESWYDSSESDDAVSLSSNGYTLVPTAVDKGLSSSVSMVIA